MTVHIVHCTCPDAVTADRIATTLVDEGLAACVNVLPGVRAVYRWQGTVEHTDEVLLLAKTSTGSLEALTARIGELHPYELPEIVAVEAKGGSAAYLAWVAEATGSGAANQ
jgi:periplasmic divalent cation tolerance protein